MANRRDHIQVFAVVRLDLPTLQTDPALSVKIVEVLPDEQSAAREADRLNTLNEHKGARYLMQSTHWYPLGR